MPVSTNVMKSDLGGMYKDDFKQHFLIDLHKFLIPIVNVRGFLITRVILLFLDGIIFMMVRPFKNL